MTDQHLNERASAQIHKHMKCIRQYLIPIAIEVNAVLWIAYIGITLYNDDDARRRNISIDRVAMAYETIEWNGMDADAYSIALAISSKLTIYSLYEEAMGKQSHRNDSL